MSDMVVIVGPDPEKLAAACKDAKWNVSRVAGRGKRSALKDAGVPSASVVVLTDPDDATMIPLARELNTDVRIVVYTDRSVAEFARHQADLLLDPALVPPSLLVEELEASLAD